tara:strand:+ start:1931 stop:2467 length:537 start_codon:yes stop_codon:yes gene_type:complete
VEWSDLIGPALGVFGIPIGILLGEYLHRKRRPEQFAVMMFEKRIEAYETLLRLIYEASSVADIVMNSSDMSFDEKHEMMGEVILRIAEHTDRTALYIDEELGVHCVALFVDAEDFGSLPDEIKEQAKAEYQRGIREARRMILEDSGVVEMKKLFHSINKPVIKSPTIEFLRSIRRKRG